MPVHDWTRSSPGTFHHFHTSWILRLSDSLNSGVLPEGFYAMAEQVAGEIGPDMLALRGPGSEGPQKQPGTIALADRPPRVSVTSVGTEADRYASMRRTLVIRHASGDRIVAMVEIVSPGNKNSRRAIEAFLDKAYSALCSGVHLLVIDLFPPGKRDPQGMHGAIWGELVPDSYAPPREKPLTVASYSAGHPPRAYVEPIAVGSVLPDMPLFLAEDAYVEVQLESTYAAAWSSVPERWRNVMESPGGT